MATLERYCCRVLVLAPQATAHDAARAMSAFGAGFAVVFSDQGRLEGIITERDTTLHVVAAGRDPRATAVKEVMSSPVLSVPMSASVAEVLGVMREGGCRRVPIVDGDRPVGVVTLEGLLTDGLVGLPEAQEIARAELRRRELRSEAQVTLDSEARWLIREARALSRREARADRAYQELVSRVQESTGLSSRAQAERVLWVVLAGLCRRAGRREAHRLLAQLPPRLAAELSRSPSCPDVKVKMEVIAQDLSRSTGMLVAEAMKLVPLVCGALATHASMGEAGELYRQLPGSLRGFFPELAPEDLARAS